MFLSLTWRWTRKTDQPVPLFLDKHFHLDKFYESASRFETLTVLEALLSHPTLGFAPLPTQLRSTEILFRSHHSRVHEISDMRESLVTIIRFATYQKGGRTHHLESFKRTSRSKNLAYTPDYTMRDSHCHRMIYISPHRTSHHIFFHWLISCFIHTFPDPSITSCLIHSWNSASSTQPSLTGTPDLPLI